jgi:hypothetical protein
LRSPSGTISATPSNTSRRSRANVLPIWIESFGLSPARVTVALSTTVAPLRCSWVMTNVKCLPSALPSP